MGGVALIFCVLAAPQAVGQPLPDGWHPPMALPTDWDGGGGGGYGGGGYHITSFFDVFTELSLDDVTGPLVPPPLGWSFTTSDYLVSTQVTGPFGGGPSTVPLTGAATIEFATLSADPGQPTYVGMQILSLTATNPNFPSILLRDSLTLASGGEGAVTYLNGERYNITSFFDVFTELSLDGGQTWTPSNGSMHLAGALVVPEPGTFILTAIGGMLLAFVAIRRRRRSEL